MDKQQIMTIATPVRDNRGMATSLLDTVAAIAIVAMVSSIALVAAMSHIEAAKISRAVAGTEMIGISIHGFVNDTGLPPAFRSGTDDITFRIL
jgi:type II secretory pathway pseudopilin PulG